MHIAASNLGAVQEVLDKALAAGNLTQEQYDRGCAGLARQAHGHLKHQVTLAKKQVDRLLAENRISIPRAMECWKRLDEKLE